MELRKIEEEDLEGKGVMGQPDVPGLSAEEMQAKVEEIVRSVAIEKINEIITYILTEGVTKEDLEKLLIEAGSVTSVFGRAGDIAAQNGDYTAEMVGAAPQQHCHQHSSLGSDPVMPGDIGAAEESHSHGNITAEGSIGSTNGMVIMTGMNGKLEAKAKENSGLEVIPKTKTVTGAFTAENNVNYEGYEISDFIFTCDTAKTASCHGFITFGTVGTITLSGFDFIDDPEGITEAEANSRWEFDLLKGCLVIRKRS